MRPGLSLVLDVLHQWTWRHSAWACFVGAANVFCNGTPLANYHMPYSASNALVFNIIQFGFPLVFALGLADRLSDRGGLPDGLAYLAAVLLTVVVGVWCIPPMLYPWLGRAAWWNEAADWSLAASSFVWLLLGAGVYAQRRINLRARAQLDAAERRRADHERALATAQLLTLQARVDPELLFERLRAIDAELVTAPDTARHRLSALIDLLRLLQPHHDAKVSHLGQEFQAAALLARLLGHEARAPERLHLLAQPGTEEQPMAPSVLLPLLRAVLRRPGTLWSLDALRLPGRVQVRLSALGPDSEQTLAAAQAVPITMLRDRLCAVHGSGARFELLDTPLPSFEISWPAS